MSKKPEVIAFFEKTKKAAKPFFEAFKEGIKTIFPALKTFVQFIFNNKPLLIAAIVAVGVAIATTLGPVSLAVAAIVGIVTVIGYVKANWDSIWGAILSFFDKIMTGIKAVFNSKFAWLLPGGAMIKAIIAIRKNWDTIWKNIVKVFLGAAGGLVKVYNNTIAKIPGVAKIDMKKIESSVVAVEKTVEIMGEEVKDTTEKVIIPSFKAASTTIATESSAIATAAEASSERFVQTQKDIKAAIESVEKANQKAAEDFYATSEIMRWNISATGIAWQDLGGSVESIVGAMATTTGRSEASIITSFEGMREEGERWKDLLLRLEKEGVINLGELGAAMSKMEADTRRAKEEQARLNEILGATVDEMRDIADAINDRGAATRRNNEIDQVRQQVAQARALGANVDPALRAQAELFKEGEAQKLLAIAASMGAHITETAIDALVEGSTAHLGRPPGFARGVRNFRGGRALVGEEGPEVVDLPGGLM